MMRSLLAAALGSLVFGSVASAAPAAGPPLLVIHHHLADYAKWRPAYDADKPARDAAGLSNCQVRSTIDDPNDVFIACQVADVQKARAFTTAPRLADVMKDAGVIGKPDFYLLTPDR